MVKRGISPDVEKLSAIFKAAGLELDRKRVFNGAPMKSAQGYNSRGNTFLEKEEYAQAAAAKTMITEANLHAGGDCSTR